MKIIDSHTEGEPTRLIIAGGPDLGTGPLSERRRIFAEKFDHIRTFCLNEPRGFDAIVGALLCTPADPTCDFGLIFFNNKGYLGMCGHGTIGAVATLAHLGRINEGRVRIETPVGLVSAAHEAPDRVTIENVPAYVSARGVRLQVDGLGEVTGDVAWGGNWFFLSENVPCTLVPGNIPALCAAGRAVRNALQREGITGADGAPVDHIEFFSPGSNGADCCNFVLCPGDTYDRSPCGTGTSAKLACLAHEGKLAPGETWVQDSIIGGRFSASYRRSAAGDILPTISGRAWITAQIELIRDPNDPFPDGIPTA